MLVIMGISVLYVENEFIIVEMYSPYTPLLVVLQLCGAGTVFYFLYELLDYYGLCSVLTLFFASMSCRTILWQAFSPITYNYRPRRSEEFEGAILAFIHLLFIRTNKMTAFYQVFFRQNLPNFMQLAISIVILTIVIYLQGISNRLDR